MGEVPCIRRPLEVALAKPKPREDPVSRPRNVVVFIVAASARSSWARDWEVTRAAREEEEIDVELWRRATYGVVDAYTAVHRKRKG